MEPFEPGTPEASILPRCRPRDPSRAGPSRSRRAVRGPPFAIAASRCNRCGACLRLDCGAISDPGGEALAVDAGACTGCGDCAPVCRARALAPIVAGGPTGPR